MHKFGNMFTLENSVPHAQYTATILGDAIEIGTAGSIGVCVYVSAIAALSAVNKFTITVEESETSGGVYTETDSENIVPANSWNLLLDNNTVAGTVYQFEWASNIAAKKFIKIQAEMGGTADATFSAFVAKSHLAITTE